MLPEHMVRNASEPMPALKGMPLCPHSFVRERQNLLPLVIPESIPKQAARNSPREQSTVLQRRVVGTPFSSAKVLPEIQVRAFMSMENLFKSLAGVSVQPQYY